MVGRRDAAPGCPVGGAKDEYVWRRLLDHRRYGLPEEGKACGGRGAAILRGTGQTGQLPGRVSISLATEQASVPVAYRLYLPKEWAQDPERCRKAGVPADIGFATKNEIALQQLETLLAEGAPKYCVLADAGYGVDQAFRQRLTELGLPYVVGIKSSVVVWPPGLEPLPPKPYSGMGRPPVVPRRTKARQPISVKDLAYALPPSAFQTISWRQGTNGTLSGRFAAVRVRPAGGNIGKARLHPEQWLLIEWPAGDADPLKYSVSTLPDDIALNDLVAQAHMRWRIERDYQDLKQELGLGHYEGRGWRGFHHHAALSIAAYGFLVTERITASKSAGAKKNFAVRKVPALPADYIPRGSPARTAARVRLNHHNPLPAQLSLDRMPRTMSLLRTTKRKTTFVTQ